MIGTIAQALHRLVSLLHTRVMDTLVLPEGVLDRAIEATFQRIGIALGIKGIQSTLD